MCNMHNSAATKLWQSAQRTKVKKVEKNPLTIGGRSAIICEHWTRAPRKSEGRQSDRPRTKIEKSWKTFEKPLDKWKEMWYTNRVALRKAKDPEKITKIFEKLFKNLLTKRKRCDIIVGHFRRRLESGLKRSLKKTSKNFSKTPWQNETDVI